MTDQANAARQNAMQIEAKKDGLSQLQSGEWVLKLKLHADDIPTPLLTAPMGTRYVLAVVEIGDDEEPVRQDPEKPKGKSYAQQAGICCNEPAFWRFIESRTGMHGKVIADADVAAQWVRDYCGVDSRSELIAGTDPGDAWHYLSLDYKHWLNS